MTTMKKSMNLNRGILFWLGVLIVLALLILYLIKGNTTLLETVHDRLEEKTKYQNLSASLNPTLIFREEFKFSFSPSLFNIEDHVRYKREAPGTLKAKDIEANNIRTKKMYAKQVVADVVKANKVKAIMISIGKAFSMRTASNKRQSDTLVLNRDGPDPTDSSVTIVLEREGQPVSINGHPSHEEEKGDLLKLKKSLDDDSDEDRSIPRKQPFKNLRQNNRPKSPLYGPLQRGYQSMKKNPKLEHMEQKRRIMEHWRRKILQFQKRRQSNNFVITSNPIYSTKSTLPLMPRVQPMVQPIQHFKPYRKNIHNLVPILPPARPNSYFIKPRYKPKRFGAFSDFDSSEWDDREFGPGFVRLSAFEWETSSSGTSKESTDSDSDFDSAFDSSEDEDLFSDKKKATTEADEKSHQHRINHKYVDEYSYESEEDDDEKTYEQEISKPPADDRKINTINLFNIDQTDKDNSEYEYYSYETDSESSAKYKPFNTIQLGANQIPDSANIDNKIVQIKTKDPTDSESHYNTVSDFKRNNKSSHKKYIKHSSEYFYSESGDSDNNIKRTNFKPVISSGEYFYSESSDSDTSNTIKATKQDKDTFFSESAEAWFNGEPKGVVLEEVSAYEQQHTRPEQEAKSGLGLKTSEINQEHLSIVKNLVY